MGSLKTRLVLSAVLMGAVLGGCASDGTQGEASASQAETQQPVSIEIVPQYDTDPAKAIDTSHLPTKTIQTPWGPREIPDQSKNPELREALVFLENVGGGASQPNKIYESQLIAYEITQIQLNDLLRLGCMEYRDYGCNYNRYYYAENCGKKHNFGKNTLSECEKRNQRWIPRNAISYKQCRIHGALVLPHDTSYREKQKHLSLDERLHFMLNPECKIWRRELDKEK